MFAIVRTGGKQYRVCPSSKICVEKLNDPVGSSIVLNDVLMFFDGKKNVVEHHLLQKVHVEATVIDQFKDKKVIVFKKKRRHNYRRKKGHRQSLTYLTINSIQAT